MKSPIVVTQQLSNPLNGGGVQVKPSAGPGERVLRVTIGSAVEPSFQGALTNPQNTAIRQQRSQVNAARIIFLRLTTDVPRRKKRTLTSTRHSRGSLHYPRLLP